MEYLIRRALEDYDGDLEELLADYRYEHNVLDTGPLAERLTDMGVI